MRVKRFLLFILLTILLFFDYAALDDITTGNQPSNVVEYGFLMLSGLIFFLVGYRYYCKKVR